MKPLLNQASARNLEMFLQEHNVFEDFIGVADGNNFFVSCERLYRPELIGVPIVVLSNNNGCIISRSSEAKALGIPMGAPIFKWEKFFKQHHVIACEGRQSLYGHISKQLMHILSGFVPSIEIYSIDEAFLDFGGMKHVNLYDYGQNIVKITDRNSGIPVALGIAPTKTLAKLANRLAKKYRGCKNLCIIDEPYKLLASLKQINIGDIWGIGHQQQKRLNKAGVFNAYEFTQMPQEWVRKELTVVGERTWLELRGIKCLDITGISPEKKQICVSRTFEKDIRSYDEVRGAVASFATMCAYKLRRQHSYAQSLLVFIQTNLYKDNVPHLLLQKEVKLPVAANDDMDISRYAHEAFKGIYIDLPFKRAGVIITSITHNPVQGSLFHQKDYNKSGKLMSVIDQLNQQYGRNKVSIAARGETNKFFRKFPIPLLEVDMDI